MSLSRKSPEIVVSVEGFGPLVGAELLTLDMSLGGGTPDTAVFVMRYLGPRDQYIAQDMKLSDFMRLNGVQPFIVITTRESPAAGWTTLHRGQLVAVNWTTGPEGEWLTYTSRADWHLLQSVADDAEGDSPWIHNLQYQVGTSYDDDLAPYVSRGVVVFNPILDGKTVPNWRDVGDDVGRLVWESSIPRIPTEDALLDQWHLTRIVHWLLATYNPLQSFVHNPDYEDIRSVLGEDFDLVRDLRIDLTKPLATTLDDVLSPYGCTWFLNHNAALGTTFAFVNKREINVSTTLRYPRYGEPAQGALPTVGRDFNLQFDISSNAANLFALQYAGSIVEASFELYPAWDMAYDDYQPEDLEETEEEVELTPELKRVFREWVLNEAASYYVLEDRGIGRFSGHNMLQQAFRKTGDLTKEEEVAVLRHREFLPMLTQDDDGSPKGSGRGCVEVEYSEDGGTTWKPISELLGNDFSITVLRSECGIRFASGERPPEEFFIYRDEEPTIWWETFKLRVTACVQGDPVLETRSSSPAAGMSWLPWWKPYYRDMGDVALAVVSEDSKYYEDVRNHILKAAERDRKVEAELYLRRIQAVYSNASITGTITLEGLDRGQFYLGKNLGGVVVRDLWFNITPPAFEYDMYPLVIDVHYDIQKQEVTMTLETYRGE